MPMTNLDDYPNAILPASNHGGLSQGSSSAVILTGALHAATDQGDIHRLEPN